MSSEHTWCWEKPLPDRDRFAQWSRDVAILLEWYPFYFHWSETSVPSSGSIPQICGPDGTGEPIITASEVALNGDAATGKNYETFAISFQELQQAPFCGGCRISQKPYDLLVSAALVRLAFYFPKIQVSSDGGVGGLQAGTLFCCEVFGSASNPELERALQTYGLNSLELLSSVHAYPNLYSLKYVLAWYEYRHPQQKIRSATLRGRVQLTPTSSHDPTHPSFYDLINDSTACVWNVRTGGAFEISSPLGMVSYGSDFPPADYLTNEATRLARQFRGTDYHLGTIEEDLFMNKEDDFNREELIYFRDGSIMRVRIPDQIITTDGGVVATKGIIAYSMLQNRLTLEPMFQVIDQEVYQTLYHTTEPAMFRYKLLERETHGE